VISILIIGNEILSNQVQDHNLKVMLAELNKRSYKIDEVRIIRDDMDTISNSVRELSAQSTYLISTGGVGPTHDDITLEAYARAFDVPLKVNAQLEARLRQWLQDKPMKESLLRMVRMPENVELVDLGPKTWPLVKVKNCFVLPGLPEVFDKKFKGLLDVLPPVAKRFFAEAYTTSDETDFAAGLTHIQEAFPDVEIGSYPSYNNPDFAAHVTLKGTHVDLLQSAFRQVTRLFEESNSLVRATPPH